MADELKSLARMQYGIDNLYAFYCHNMRGCPALGRMGTGSMRDPYKTMFNNACKNREIDYVVYSFETPIAWHYSSGEKAGTWEIPNVRYSVTTTSHQKTIRTAIENPNHYCVLALHVAGTGVR